MATFDASNADCLIFTFKEGLLSKVAHDLKLEVTRFTVEAPNGNGSLRATLATDSLRVVAAMRDGHEVSVLSDGDKAKIEKTVAGEVLSAEQFPEVVFEGEVKLVGDEARLDGALQLHGRTRPLSFAAKKKNDRWVARVRLHQPDFDIKPFKAMMGTLRVQPDVEVELRIPA